MAHIVSHGNRIEYQDTGIAASCLVETVAHLVAENGRHFRRIPGWEDRVAVTREAMRRIKSRQ